MNYTKEQIKEVSSRSLAVIGFIAVLSIGLWGTVQVIKFTPTIFSSLAAVTTSLSSIFVPSEKITINTVDSLIPVDTAFDLTWKHRSNPESGLYTFSYTCREGLSFDIQNNEGVFEEKSCDTPIAFSSENNTLSLIPHSKETRFTDVSVTIASVNELVEATTANDKLITIVNEDISQGALSSNNDKEVVETITAGERKDEIFPITDSRPVSNATGEPDLSVRILGTGVVEEGGTFAIKDKLASNTSNGAVQFEVSNLGTKKSPTWTFNAVLPTFPMHIFHSDMQQALYPGDKIVFTLGFNQIDNGAEEGVITINIDPSQNIKEVTKANNIEQVIVKIVKVTQ